MALQKEPLAAAGGLLWYAFRRAFHGVFAPNSRHRVTITPALRNKTKQALPTGQEKTRAQKHQSMTWAQRLKRVLIITKGVKSFDH
jgi:hypothetical protein